MKKQDSINHSLKIIVKSSVFVFIGIFLAKIFSYAYRVIIAQSYGPEAYGLFSLALMVVSWISIIAIFGLESGLIRYISIYRGRKEKNKVNYIFRKSFYFLLVTGIAGGTLLFFSSSFIANNIFNEPGLTLFLKLFSIALPFNVLFVSFLSLLRAYQKVGWSIFISNFLINFLYLAFILLFIVVGFGVIAIPLSYVIGTFLVFLVLIVVLKKQVPEISIKKSKENFPLVFREILSYSWPLIFAGALWKLFKWTDLFFIGFFMTAADVGFYNAALPIALLLSFSSDIFMQMFNPLIIKEYSKNRVNNIKQLSKQVGKWIYMINLPILMLLIVFPGAFLNILFGEEFLVAENALRILSIGAFFLSFNGISLVILGALGKSKTILYNSIIISVINLILNILLIPKYGITGAAISTSFSLLVLNFIFTFQVYKKTGIIPIRKKNLNVFFSAVISLGALLLIKSFVVINFFSLILLIAFFIFIYIFLILIFGSFDKSDVMIFKSFLGKFKRKNK